MSTHLPGRLPGRPTTARLLPALALVVAAALPAAAQIGPGPVAAFPTADPIDGRMLSFGCAGIETLANDIQLSIEVPSEETSLSISVFDGDTGKADASGKKHWDAGTRQLVFSLYADRFLQGSTATPIASWTGNAPNPLSGPGWSMTAAEMPDNDWWGVTLDSHPAARAPSGNYFYLLKIELDGGGCATPTEVLASDFKVAASSPLTFLVPRFGFEASLRQVLNDGQIVYPDGFPPADNDVLGAATTFDGTFEFVLNLPAGATELRLFDGDFDHGTSAAGLTALPSGRVLAPCADTDDPDTDAAYSTFPFSAGDSAPEGAVGPGSPADDSFFDVFRRGEPGDPDRMGCVRYVVTAPDARQFRNDNPSGNLEWEQFRIVSALAADPGLSDYQIADDYLPAGEWTVEIFGLDMSNLNFWFIEADVCPFRDGVSACPRKIIYLVGDTVWYDEDGDGIQDPGENGIPGVTLNLYTEIGGPLVGTTSTADDGNLDWTECLLNNTGLDELGLYCFGATAPGPFIVEVAPENFGSGGLLAGLASTTGGEVHSDAVVDDNVLTYDFGYRALTECGPCLGKVSELTFRFEGSQPTLVEIFGQRGSIKDDPLFSGVVSPGEWFRIEGPNTGGGGFQGTLGTEIDVYLDGVFDLQIHTSCSQEIGPGMLFGVLRVVAGSSKQGGPLCPVDGGTSPLAGDDPDDGKKKPTSPAAAEPGNGKGKSK